MRRGHGDFTATPESLKPNWWCASLEHVDGTQRRSSELFFLKHGLVERAFGATWTPIPIRLGGMTALD